MSFLTLARLSFMVLPWILLVYLGYFISQIKIEPMVFSMDPKGKITCISKKILDQKTIKEVEKQSLVRQFMTFYFNWDSHLFADRMGEAGSFVTADRWEKERVSLLEKREFLKKVYEIHRSKLTGLFEVNEEQLRAELEITIKKLASTPSIIYFLTDLGGGESQQKTTQFLLDFECIVLTQTMEHLPLK